MKLARLVKQRLADRRIRQKKKNSRRYIEQFDAQLEVRRLEDRVLLSVTTNLSLDSAGNLIIADSSIGAGARFVTLQSDSSQQAYVVSINPSSEITVTGIQNASGALTNTVIVPFASVTGDKIIAWGGANVNRFTLDLSLGGVAKSIEVSLGGGNDQFRITGNGTVASLVVNGNDGTDSARIDGDVTATGSGGISLTVESITQGINGTDSLSHRQSNPRRNVDDPRWYF
jgi:hypothetical protein